MSGRLGLTKEARQLLDDLEGWGSWVAIGDLCVARDGTLVIRCLDELRRAGFVKIERSRRGRRIVELTDPVIRR